MYSRDCGNQGNTPDMAKTQEAPGYAALRQITWSKGFDYQFLTVDLNCSVMDAIKMAIYNLQDSIPAVERKRDKEVENALMHLYSTANLLVGCIYLLGLCAIYEFLHRNCPLYLQIRLKDFLSCFDNACCQFTRRP